MWFYNFENLRIKESKTDNLMIWIYKCESANLRILWSKNVNLWILICKSENLNLSFIWESAYEFHLRILIWESVSDDLHQRIWIWESDDLYLRICIWVSSENLIMMTLHQRICIWVSSDNLILRICIWWFVSENLYLNFIWES